MTVVVAILVVIVIMYIKRKNTEHIYEEPTHFTPAQSIQANGVNFSTMSCHNNNMMSPNPAYVSTETFLS